jgi:hypothetical protein
MTVKSRRGVLVGAFIALVVPISYLVVALLVENGIAPYDQTHDLFLGPLSVLGWISLFLLGPIGIVVAVRAAGLGRGEGVAVGIVALPVSAIVWFMCVATLGGALGNPF